MKQHAARMMATALVATFGLSGIVQAQPLSSSTRQIPTDTVVQLQLANALSSRSARQGDLFTARLSERDHSGFPLRTRFEGSVIESRPATKDRPGVLGIKIHRAFLPDGSIVAVNGTLAGLDEDSVQRRSSGRLEARSKAKGKLDMKWIGYGAAGGAVLGTVLGGGDDLLKGALLGALGGAAYSYLNKDKDHKRTGYSDVQLARDTDFGIRVHNTVAFHDKDTYRYAAYDRGEDRVYRDGDNRRRDDRYDRNSDRDYDRDRDRDYDRDYDRAERSSDRDRYNDRETDRVNDRDDRDRDDDRDRTSDRDYERGATTRRPAH